MARKSKRKGMILGTRILYCHVSPEGYTQLQVMANRLGILRSEIWNEFGSIKGLGLRPETVRDQWLSESRIFDVPARLWKETLADTFSDISAYREAAKENVKSCIRNRTSDKAERRKSRHTANVRPLVFHAAHRLMDKVSTVVSEDLAATFVSKFFDRDHKRKMSAWVKGMIADAITTASKRRGVTHELVNAAYTSQQHHACGTLGRRYFDSFRCFECQVDEHADENAAKTILSRLYDDEISRYMPFKQVKNVILSRSDFVAV